MTQIVDSITIRQAEPRDVAELAALRHALWPDTSVEQHAKELAPMLAGKTLGNFPSVILLAFHRGELSGFIEITVRSHADGCDPSCPVGYVEGWYVAPARRRQNFGAALLAQAERWARHQGCREMASDTWIDNLDSQRVHESLGFEIVDRCVHYRKPL